MINGYEPRLSASYEKRYSDYLWKRGLMGQVAHHAYVRLCDRKRQQFRWWSNWKTRGLRHTFFPFRAYCGRTLARRQEIYLRHRLEWKAYNTYRSIRLSHEVHR